MSMIGLTADLFDTRGDPLFGSGPFELFREAGLTWTLLKPDRGVLDPADVAAYDALFINGSRVPRQSLSQDTGRLRVVARYGVGFDGVDVDALSERGILLTNTPAAVSHPVASIALTLILALTLRLPQKSRLPREGRWAERGDFTGVALPGRTLGIVGLGGIGRELARLIEPFHMRLVVFDPYLTQDRLAGTGIQHMPIEVLLAESDVVVIACPLNQSTFHLIDAARLALMRPSTFLINVARGPIVDEQALIAALQAGKLAGAGLDVFEQEPVDPANPLLKLETVIATPHSLCWTDGFLGGIARSAIGSIIDVLGGRLPEYIVNRAAVSHPRVAQWLTPPRSSPSDNR